jgi:hypothetical protein
VRHVKPGDHPDPARAQRRQGRGGAREAAARGREQGRHVAADIDLDHSFESGDERVPIVRVGHREA